MKANAPLIMIIRHGEKPLPQCDGINEAGKSGDKNLIVLGWQRAGALVRFFAPSSGEPAAGRLTRPAYLFACGPHAQGSDPDDTSKREEQTISPLAADLGLEPDLRFGVDQEQEVATAAAACDGPVLICWEHKRIPKLTALLSDDPAVPSTWPKERFDMVFCLRLRPDGSEYSFEQVPQLVLAGDSAVLFPD